MHTVHDLSRDECARLLADGTVGRVAVCTPMGPHIVPVEHAVDGESVLVHAAPHSLLATYGRGTVLCFEAGRLDDQRERSWSVAVRGRAEFIDDAEALARISDALQHRWGGGPRGLVVRIPWTEVTGRTLGNSWDPVT